MITLLKPAEDETQQAFSERFNALPEVSELIADAATRAAAAAILWERRHNARTTAPAKRYVCNFIEPGLVKYEDVPGSGHLLVRKPALDRARNTIVGVPVMDMRHRTPAPEKWREEADGVVTRAWHDADSGEDWCEYIVWDPQLQALCDLGADTGKFSVSCAYDPLEGDETGGEWHAIPYEGEVTELQYTHLAIVPNPRYETARIYRLNSKGGSMKLFAWLKGTKQEIDPNATVKDKDGKDVTIASLIERANAAPAAPAITDDLEIEMADGSKKTIGELRNGKPAPTAEELAAAEALRVETERKNAKAEQDRKDAQETERRNAAAVEQKRKDDEAAAEAARKEQERLNGLRSQDLGVETTIHTREELEARGREMFGSTKQKVA